MSDKKTKHWDENIVRADYCKHPSIFPSIGKKIRLLEQTVAALKAALEKIAKLDCWECHDLEGQGYINHIETYGCYQHIAKEALRSTSERGE